MKKVNLDDEYEKWLSKNSDYLIPKFNESINYENQLQDFLEENWQEYQAENQLYDITNNDIDDIINERPINEE